MEKSMEYERFMNCLTEMLKKYGGAALKKQREAAEETVAESGDIAIRLLIRMWKQIKIQFVSNLYLLQV